MFCIRLLKNFLSALKFKEYSKPLGFSRMAQNLIIKHNNANLLTRIPCARLGCGRMDITAGRLPLITPICAR